MKPIVSLGVVIFAALFFAGVAWGEVPQAEGQRFRVYYQGEEYFCVPQGDEAYALYKDEKKWATFYRLRPFKKMPYPEVRDRMPITANVRCFALEYEDGKSVFAGYINNSSELRDAMDLISRNQWEYHELVICEFTPGLKDLKKLAKVQLDDLSFARSSFPSNMPEECYPSCRRLSLLITSIPSDFLEGLAENRTIEGLRILSPPAALSNADFVSISKMKTLKILSLLQKWQKDLDLSPLAELPHLEGLQLGGDLKALDLGFLSKMPALEILSVPEGCQLPETLKKEVQVLRE